MELLIDPKKEILRIGCGQCGDSKDLHFSISEEGRLSIEIFEDSMDYDLEALDCGAPNLMKPVTVIV